MVNVPFGKMTCSNARESGNSEFTTALKTGGQTQPRCRDMTSSRMKKVQTKLTPAEKARKKERRAEYMTIFINGKQKVVKRSPTFDGSAMELF